MSVSKQTPLTNLDVRFIQTLRMRICHLPHWRYRSKYLTLESCSQYFTMLSKPLFKPCR